MICSQHMPMKCIQQNIIKLILMNIFVYLFTLIVGYNRWKEFIAMDWYRYLNGCIPTDMIRDILFANLIPYLNMFRDTNPRTELRCRVSRIWFDTFWNNFCYACDCYRCFVKYLFYSGICQDVWKRVDGNSLCYIITVEYYHMKIFTHNDK